MSTDPTGRPAGPESEPRSADRGKRRTKEQRLAEIMPTVEATKQVIQALQEQIDASGLSEAEKKVLADELKEDGEKAMTALEKNAAPPKNVADLVFKIARDIFKGDDPVDELKIKVQETLIAKSIPGAGERVKTRFKNGDSPSRVQERANELAKRAALVDFDPDNPEKTLEAIAKLQEEIQEAVQKAIEGDWNRVNQQLADLEERARKAETTIRMPAERRDKEHWWLTDQEKKQIEKAVSPLLKAKQLARKTKDVIDGTSKPRGGVRHAEQPSLSEVTDRILDLDVVSDKYLSPEEAEDLKALLRVAIVTEENLTIDEKRELARIFDPAFKKLDLMEALKRAERTSQDEVVRQSLEARLRPGDDSFLDQLYDPRIKQEMAGAVAELFAKTKDAPKEEHQKAYDKLAALIEAAENQNAILQRALLGGDYDLLRKANIARGISEQDLDLWSKARREKNIDLARQVLTRNAYASTTAERGRLSLMLRPKDLEALGNEFEVEKWFEYMLNEAREKTPERSTYFQILTLAYTEVAGMHKYGEGYFAPDENGRQRNEELFKRLTVMFRAKLNFISAFNMGDISQNFEARTKSLIFFTSKEIAWFGKQWWLKLAWNELIEHPDLVLDYLKMGEKDEQIVEFKKLCRRRSNQILSQLISHANLDQDSVIRKEARVSLDNIFGQALKKEGTDQSDYSRGNIRKIIGRGEPDSQEHEIKKYTDVNNKETMRVIEEQWLTDGDIEWTYDFARWFGRQGEHDALFTGHKYGLEKAKAMGKDKKAQEQMAEDYEWYGRKSRFGKDLVKEGLYGPDALYDEEKGEIIGGKLQVKVDRDKDFRWLVEVKGPTEMVRKFENMRTVKEAFRRGEFDSSVRKACNPYFSLERIGLREMKQLRKIWARLFVSRSLLTYEWGQSRKEKGSGGFIDIADKHGVSFWDAKEEYALPMSFDISQYASERMAGETNEHWQERAWINALSSTDALNRHQAALEAVSLIGTLEREKATHVVDWHGDMQGMIQGFEAMTKIAREPGEAIEKELINDLMDTNWISKHFQMPKTDVGIKMPEKGLLTIIGKILERFPSHKYSLIEEQKDFALTLNNQAGLATVWAIMAGLPQPPDAKFAMIHKLKRETIADVPPNKPWWNPRKIRARFTNWWNFEVYAWHVLGGNTWLRHRVLGKGWWLWDLLKALTKTGWEEMEKEARE